MSERPQILCVDDEKDVLSAFKRVFIDNDYVIFTAESGEEGLKVLEENPLIQVVISDYRMPEMNGIDFLRQVWSRWPNTIRLVISGNADALDAVDALREGQIYKFLAKPWNDDELRKTTASAIETYDLRRRNNALADEFIEMWRKDNE